MNDLAVLIPVYNDQGELFETLYSIQEEDNSFTVVIVDDGSLPPLKIDSFTFPFKIKLISLPINKGIVEALNTGLNYILEKEHFNFIARLDAGDFQSRNRLMIQYQYLQENPHVFLLGSSVDFISESKKTLYTYSPPIDYVKIKKTIFSKCCFIHPSVMINQTVFKCLGLYPQNYQYAEDYALFIKITKKFKAENLNLVLLKCTIRDKGISNLKRRTQMISTLKLLWDNKQLSVYWIHGVLITGIKLLIPRKFVSNFRSLAKKSAQNK